MTPATAQIISDIPGEPVFFKTTTGEIKIPDPITTPIICAAPSSNPNFFGSKVLLTPLLSLFDKSALLFRGCTIIMIQTNKPIA